MKKRYALLISIIVMGLLLSGCSSNGNQSINNNIIANQVEIEEVPEPYTRAILALNNQDWELANTYLALVLKDFPNSDYVLPTKILQNTMLISELMTSLKLSSYFTQANPNTNLFDQTEVDLHSEYTFDIQETIIETEPQISALSKEIIAAFDLEKDYRPYFEELALIPFKNYSDHALSFYQEVGYPLPTKAEVNEYKENKYEEYMLTFLNLYGEDKAKFNYHLLPLFMYIGNIYDSTDYILRSDANNMILKITAGDTYNETRVRINKWIEENRIETNDNGEIVVYRTEAKAYEWGPGIKEEFEKKMIENGYADTIDNLYYRDGFIGEEDGCGYYSTYTIDPDGTERYIVVVNVKTGWYHG